MKNRLLYTLLLSFFFLNFIQASSNNIYPTKNKTTLLCSAPTGFSYSFVSGTNNILLTWANTTNVSWEVATQSTLEAPAVDFMGEVVNTNSYTATNLVAGNAYYFYVRSVCSDNTKSNWTLGASIPVFYNQSTNDEPTQALALAVNTGILCNNINSCVLAGGTPSSSVPVPACVNTLGNDIWYKFTATEIRHVINSFNSNIISIALYSGDGGNLNYLGCTTNSANGLDYSSYTIGNEYYIRVWSSVTSTQIVAFDLCIKSVADCAHGELFCGSNANDPYIFENVVGVPSTGQVACLGSMPNPRYITLKVTESGPLQYQIIQSTSFDVAGNPTGNYLDVDFVTWGPFTNADSCDQIAFADCPTCPFDNSTPSSNTFYPFGNITDCSYSSSYTENLHIPNAQAGQYYKLLITNFNGASGYIKLIQTNYDAPGSGRTACADKLQLVAFVDLNADGIKDANEFNFPYGTFDYQVNDAAEVTHINTPTGRYDLFDSNPANSYDISYQVYPEFTNHYGCTTTVNNLNIGVDQGVEVVYFPVVPVNGAFYDPMISISSVNPPVPGMTHHLRIAYKNDGNTLVSGTVAFTKDPLLTISSVSEATITNTANGFTYNFTDLAPFQTKFIDVYLSVPVIPNINIWDFVTNSVQLTTAAADVNLNNNAQTLTEAVVASYDPNDKMEVHGGQILISDFDNSDYLQYTIRFQNTGTANAINVRIVDILSELLDEQSVRMVSATHNYTLQRINNQLVWSFNNIQLKPKIQNEELSQGQLVFLIKPRPGYQVNTTISNVASIFFDTNPPIVTEEAKTTFVNALANQQFTDENWSIYPNPANDLIQIELSKTTDLIKEIELTDLLGKTVLRKINLKDQQQTLDISNLSQGVYMVSITTQNDFKQVKKLVVK